MAPKKNSKRVASGRQSLKLEIHPDAQRRFERAVDAAVKGGPIHRKPKTEK